MTICGGILHKKCITVTKPIEIKEHSKLIFKMEMQAMLSAQKISPQFFPADLHPSPLKFTPQISKVMYYCFCFG